MPGLLQQAGAQPQRQPKYVPIFIDRTFTGLFTQRNVLHDPSDLATARFYGGRPDALWMGSNVELTNRLTLQRRPGLSPFSTATYPTPPDRAFSFQLSNGTIQVIVDTESTGSLVLTSVAASVAGSAVYTGTITGGIANAFVGLIFSVTGFTNISNNGTYLCTASTTTTLTLANANAIAETTVASTISAGAVYVDNQNGTKTFLFAKSVGAGQGYFVAVAGILYIGDGVDVRKYTPGNTNGTIWNWGIAAPTSQPSVTIVESGSAAVQWAANTVWSTMGLVYDAATGTIQQLNSVNASTTNTTQFGTTGNGQPSWNQNPGGTTTDNTITWENFGPIVAWTANTVYNNASIGGTATNPCIIYDPNTKACYINGNPGDAQGTSGSAYPNFKAGAGQTTEDGKVKWFYVGTPGVPGTWQASHLYPKLGTVTNNDASSSIVEPVGLQNGLPTNQTVYWQISTGGTSGTGGTTPKWNVLAGQITGGDGDNLWLSLGSGNWAATTTYAGWTASGTVFSAVKDTNGNFQVCTTTGTSATVEPGTSFTLSAAATAAGGNTVYTGTFSPIIPVGTGNLSVVIAGFTNAANNGTFQIVSCTSTQLTVNNPSGVAETHAGTAVYNPWNAGYGKTTKDGTAVWTCVGTATVWAVSTQWFLPTSGFSPPSTSSPYGGASVIDSNGDVEFIVNSGKGGGTAPTWAGVGSYTDDGGTSFTLSQVTVNANGTSTYTGTGLTGLMGQQLLVSGFTNAGNNGLIVVLSSTATTLVITTTSQVNETHAGTAKNGAIWYNLEVFSANSLAWTKGYIYAYSFKARSLTDFYSTAVNGMLPVPPGLANALPAPTGSETGAISTASPIYTITGSNAGAVNTIMGLGSTDPQVDTIVIWRSADGGSSSSLFELVEIPSPPPIGGVSQPWSFKDFLPDTPTNLYPGLNILIPAPIDDSNDPPPSGFLPQVYNFDRIWGSLGDQVFFSGGPDVPTGNPNEAFNPADEFQFLANVIRLFKTSQGLVTFLTDSIEMIGGGPATSTFFQITQVPGVGLSSYNAADIYGAEIFFFSSDNQFRIFSPSLNATTIGFPIGDQFANLPSSGISDTTWNPANAYVTVHQNGIDNCVIVSDGSTGWYRLNPHQVPGGAQGPEPIWSPFANVTGGCKLVQSVETSPGIKQLLVGSVTNNQEILKRDLTTYQDNGVSYDAYFVMGSVTLAHPGQLALVKFLEFDFSGVNYNPTVSYILNGVSGSYTPFSGSPVFDPPSIYGGNNIVPNSYSPQRYYFGSNASLARCRNMLIKVDFGTTPNPDELFTMAIFGRLTVET